MDYDATHWFSEQHFVCCCVSILKTDMGGKTTLTQNDMKITRKAYLKAYLVLLGLFGSNLDPHLQNYFSKKIRFIYTALFRNKM